MPTTTGEAANPIHDEWSHGADAWRYMHTIADRMANEDWGAPLNYPDLKTA